MQFKQYVCEKYSRVEVEDKHCTIDICTEEYTSQTCGSCGVLTKVNGKDVFHCSQCGIMIYRDVNGARNIAIKRLDELL